MDIGIIGGADGPTKIYLASTISPYLVVAGIVILILITVKAVQLIKKQKK